jgi:hypothetical protein
MKTILKKFCAGMVLLMALAIQAQAQTLTYSNSLTLSGANPASVMAFDLPQFDPSSGTLDSVTLTMYSTFQNQFTYNGLSASGELTFTPTNSLSFLYHGPDVLAQENAGHFTFNASLPSNGQSLIPAATLSLQGTSQFSDASDLANFIGTSDVPLSGEYYFLPMVTWTSGTVTWNANDSATMEAVVMYDFTVVPEPGVTGMVCLGGLIFALHKNRCWEKCFIPPKNLD